jgi:aminopeptidase N
MLSNLRGAENDTCVVTIYYSGVATNEGGKSPFGGVFLEDSVLFANGVGFHNEYVSATQHWLPCYDHPSDKATFRFIFLYPKGFAIATNGKTEQISSLDDTTEMLVSSSKYPIATYLMTFAMGKFKKMELDPWNLPSNLAKEVFYLPEDEDAVKFAFNNFAKYFYALQNRYGRYPFEKIGYVVVPFNNGAMEHQTMITFPRNQVLSLYSKKDTNNIMALHELSHQWFGNSVSPLDFRDAWFNESFATFSEASFLEMMYGTDAYLKDLLVKKNYYINYVVKNEGLLPLYNFPRKPPSSNYPATIYVKGAVVIGMLRYLLGDELFFDVVRNYLDQFAYQSRSTNDFLNYTIAYTNLNLYWFFEQWVFQAGYPILEMNAKQYVKSNNTSSLLLTIKQVQPENYGTYFNVPVELNFQLPNNKSFDTVVILNSKEQTYWFDTIPTFITLSSNLGRKVVSLFSSTVYTSVEADTQDDLTIYNNNDKVIVKLNTQSNSIDYAIFDILGRKLAESTTFSQNGYFQIPLSGISNGLYILMLRDRGKIIYSKIMIE